jgi:O-antigen/teichoic acid export membrane protein
LLIHINDHIGPFGADLNVISSVLKRIPFSKTDLVRTAGIYTIANTLNAAIPFLMMPILTRYMSPDDYGVYVMFQLLSTFIASFTGLSIHGAISRQFIDLDKNNLSAYIANCLLILLVSSCIVIAFFCLFSSQISKISSFPREWFWSVILVAICQFLTLIVLTLYQMEKKPVSYGTLQILQTMVNIGLSIWLVVGLGFGWRGSLLGQVIAVVLTGCLSLWILWRDNWLRFVYVPEYIRHALKFGVPLIPHTIGATLIAMTDRAMIANMIGVAESGVYTVGYQFGMIIALLQNSFNQAWVPWVYEKLRKNDNIENTRIVRFTYLYFIVILLLVFSIALLAPLIMKYFVGKNFSRASDYVLWIGLGYAFNGMYKMVSVYIFYESRTHLLAWITLIAAVLNFILTYQFILLNGAIGAAQAASLSFFISFLLTWLLSARIYRMPWSLRNKE